MRLCHQATHFCSLHQIHTKVVFVKLLNWDRSCPFPVNSPNTACSQRSVREERLASIALAVLDANIVDSFLFNALLLVSHPSSISSLDFDKSFILLRLSLDLHRLGLRFSGTFPMM